MSDLGILHDTPHAIRPLDASREIFFDNVLLKKCLRLNATGPLPVDSDRENKQPQILNHENSTPTV